MPHKNMALMVIAVGCGLVAAVLSQQTKQQPVETVKVLVAAKELNAGQPFTATNAPALLKWKEIPRLALPKDLKDYVVANEKTPEADKDAMTVVAGKQLSRAMHADEPINNNDMSRSPSVFLPGMDTMSISMSARDAAGGQVGPGSKVDILAALTDSDNQRVFTLLPDVHVLAVNGIQERKGPSVFADMQNVSFAVTKQQAILLTLAKTRNCKLELLLRHPDDQPRSDWKYEDAEKWLTVSKTKDVEVRSSGNWLGIPPH